MAIHTRTHHPCKGCWLALDIYPTPTFPLFSWSLPEVLSCCTWSHSGSHCTHNQRQFPLPWNPHQIVTVPKMSRPFPPGKRVPQFSHIAALCSDGTQWHLDALCSDGTRCHPGALCGDNTQWCLGSKEWFVPLRSHLFLI